MPAALRASLAGSLDLLDVAERLKLDAIEIATLADAIHAAALTQGVPLPKAVARVRAAAGRTLATINLFQPRRVRNAAGSQNPRR